MSEISGPGEPKPQDPELLPCQVQIKDLCNEILALKPEQNDLTFWDIRSKADGEEVQERLRVSSLADLMLKDGDTLSLPESNEHYPDLGLYVGKVALVGVSVRAWGWDYDKHRIDPNGPEEPPYKIIYYPGEQDWTRQLDISLHYSNENQSARQTITTQTGSRNAGNLPSVSRDVYAMAYAETGYEGHNQLWRSAINASEVDNFLALARELVDQATS